MPAYEEIEPQIKTAWLEEQRTAARKRAFDAMKAHYEVVVSEPSRIAAAQAAAIAKSTP